MSKLVNEKRSRIQPPKIITHGRESQGPSTNALLENNASSSLKTYETPKIKGFSLKLPKINIGERISQNPKIIDLRKRLNELNKKQERSFCKVEKTLLNDIKQRFSNEETDSGPFSLLYELQTQQITDGGSETATLKSNLILIPPNLTSSVDEIMSSSSHLPKNNPQIVVMEGKSIKELEFSCSPDKEWKCSRTNEGQLAARSDLKLNFNLKSYKGSSIELFSPPTEPSSFRALDEASLDDSLGILTPDQMDDMFLEHSFSPGVEDLPIFPSDADKMDETTPENGESSLTDKTDSNSVASAVHFETNIAQKNNNVPENAAESTKEEPDHLIDNKKDVEKLMILGDEDLLPSVHSSILEPSSVNGETVNLDLNLDCKTSNDCNENEKRIDETPSPEELPLDPVDISIDITISSNSQANVSVTNSQIDSECKTDCPKSIESSKVSNSFITSITSITSLDGYQGDGEMSRPVSRGADHSPLLGLREEIIDWQNVPVNRRQDPMTDSDFFTESDVDGHDDHVNRGDRRAQVIDGALYGGKNGSNAPLMVSSRNDDSCMESSGVYTDIETNNISSPVFVNALDDDKIIPEGSSPSSQSICSQQTDKNINKSMVNLNESLKENNKKPECMRSNSKEEKRCFALKKYKMPKRDVPSKLKTMFNNNKSVELNKIDDAAIKRKTERRELPKKTNEPIKSYKDVKPKVDTFTVNRSQTTNNVSRILNCRSTSGANKTKSRHRGRIGDLGTSVLTSSSGKSSLHSSQSDISASSTPYPKQTSRFNIHRSTKKRDTATVLPPPTSVTLQRNPPTTLNVATTQNSTTLNKQQNLVKKNGTLPKLSSSPGATRSRSATSTTPPTPRKPTSTPTTNTAAATTAAKRSTLSSQKATSQHVKDQGRVVAAPQQPVKQAPRPQTAVVKQTKATVQQTSPELNHASKGVEALGVLVQYLVFQLEALNAPAWRAEAVRWRELAAKERDTAASADLAHKQRTQKDLDTISECLSKISSLERELAAKEEENASLIAKNDRTELKYTETLKDYTSLAEEIKELKNIIDTLKTEVSESRLRIKTHAQEEQELRDQLEATKAELNATRGSGASKDIMDKDKEELIAEVKSLRAVLELKQCEAGALRVARAELQSEIEKCSNLTREIQRAARANEELKARATARQAEAERLREENDRLRDMAARDAALKSRLDMYNEELRYKLRQKSRVVNLLAVKGASASAGTLHDRSFPLTRRSRTSSCGSQSDSADDSSEPAVKAMVEKQDSVSWVLEIEESAEETASRLSRRAARRANGSDSSPTSPRSPLSPTASPRQSPPAVSTPSPRPAEYHVPLKESAGDAIYIYDNRQF